MFPRIATQNLANSTTRYTIPISKLLLRYVLRGADLPYLLFGELCKLVSTSCRPSAFGVHIFDVVRLTSEEQMIRIDTAPVVAAVKDLHPSRNWTDIKFIRRPVGKMWPIVDGDLPIPQWKHILRPVPATSVWINRILRAELIPRFFGPAGVSAFLRAIFGKPLFQPIGDSFKCSAAILADARNTFTLRGRPTFSRAVSATGSLSSVRHHVERIATYFANPGFPFGNWACADVTAVGLSIWISASRAMSRVRLGAHRSLSLRCRAWGVISTARLLYFRIYKPILPQSAVL